MVINDKKAPTTEAPRLHDGPKTRERSASKPSTGDKVEMSQERPERGTSLGGLLGGLMDNYGGHRDCPPVPPRPNVQPAANRDDFAEVDFRNSERTPELIARQEEQTRQGIASGQPFQFTNGNGQTEQISLTRAEDGAYHLRGADGHDVRIQSSLRPDEEQVALARIADAYTQLPNGARNVANAMELHRDTYGNVAADYNYRSGTIRFFNGLENLNEAVFNHEIGHGVGNATDGVRDGILGTLWDRGVMGRTQGVARGWGEATAADGRAPSQYSNTNLGEDFADSWSAYLEARENGPEAVERLRRAFPHRVAILEQTYASL